MKQVEKHHDKRKSKTFEWTSQCDIAFEELKGCLAKPPVLTKPEEGEILYLYLSVGDEAVSSVLVKETKEGQKPIYFVSKALQGAELRYEKLEKAAFTILITARRLRHYFQGHQVVVRTDMPIRQVLYKPDLAGRLITWSVELSEYGLTYEGKRAIKAQVPADFVLEYTHSSSSVRGRWLISVDGSSNQKGSGAGIIVESPEGIVLEQSI